MALLMLKLPLGYWTEHNSWFCVCPRFSFTPCMELKSQSGGTMVPAYACITGNVARANTYCLVQRGAHSPDVEVRPL